MAFDLDHEKSPKAARFGTKKTSEKQDASQYVPKGMNSRRSRSEYAAPSIKQDKASEKTVTKTKEKVQDKAFFNIHIPASKNAQEDVKKTKAASNRLKEILLNIIKVIAGIPTFFIGLYHRIKNFIDNDPTKSSGTSSKGQSKILRFFADNIVLIAVSTGLFVMAFVAIYFPAKDYYVAYRHNERLQYEYVENMQRNKRIEERVKTLQTPEGIEDHAREELNMVKPGENSVNIVGAPEATQTSQTADVVDRIPQGSGTAPSNWKTRFLDFFFGVGDTSTGKSVPQKE